MRVLLVEDDKLLGDGVKKGLSQFGYTVDLFEDGESALQAALGEEFDVIVLDLGLPKMSGLSLLRELRNQSNATPVLILTARDTIDDRVRGLDAGADDYLIKPFELDELYARMRALIRRASGRSETTIHVGEIEIDPASHTVKVRGEPVILPRREFALLQKMMEHAGQVLSRQQLMQTLYGWNEEVDSNALEVHIHNLRKKIDSASIRTIRGVGYLIEK